MEFLINGIPSKIGENLNQFEKIDIVTIKYHPFERNIIDTQVISFVKNWFNDLTNKMEDDGHYFWNGIIIYKKDIIKF